MPNETIKPPASAEVAAPSLAPAPPETVTKIEALAALLPPSRPLLSQTAALAIRATLAVVYTLHWAQKFFIPLFFGIFIAYTLNPVVRWLEKLRFPRWLATVVVMITLASGAGLMTNSLYDEFQSIVEVLPASAQKVARAFKKSPGNPGTISQIQSAATEIEIAAGASTGARAANNRKVVPEGPSFRVSEWLLAGSMSAMQGIAQATIVIFLVFFLLLSGDTFKRKLVQLTGPSMSTKKTTIHILEQINTSVQAYMFMLLVTNVMLGLLMWVALRATGLENAGAWAVAAGLLHVVPYFGPLIITGATGISAFMQFESVSMALLVGAISLAIATLVGTFITTWMTGRLAKMNAAAVFISLLFWGWLWGVWGMLLGIPIIVVIKVIAEHVDNMKGIANFLGE